MSAKSRALVAFGIGTGATAAAATALAISGPTSGLLLPLAVAAAGLADGVNPCSFAGLLVFASFATSSFEANALSCHEPQSEGPPTRRGRLVRNGSVYISALFLTYMALGLGLVGVTRWITESHWVGKAAALGSLAMGVWMLRDFSFPNSRWKLEVPHSLRPRIRQALKATQMPAIFAAGILVGLCTVPCAGGIYLGILALISSQQIAQGLTLLLLYNAMFVLPLIAALGLATSRQSYRVVARWHVRRRNLVKLVLGAIMIVLGFATLYMLS